MILVAYVRTELLGRGEQRHGVTEIHQGSIAVLVECALLLILGVQRNSVCPDPGKLIQ
jgi:hypothetical protein